MRNDCSTVGPFLLIACLTVRTLALRNANAYMRQCQAHQRYFTRTFPYVHLSTPATLALLNVKFLVINLPYILLELLDATAKLAPHLARTFNITGHLRCAPMKTARH